MTVNNRLYAVRGAVCCENTAESVSLYVTRLFQEILILNGITEDEIISVVFSITDDLTALNPATALRKAGLAQDIPLFACAEPFIEGYLPSVVRVLITFYGSKKPVPVYINGAESLRPDLENRAEELRFKI